MHADGGGAPLLSEHPGWRRVNAALWALAPLLLLISILGVSSIVAQQSQDAAMDARTIASENHAYCQKWGLPTGTPEHAICVRDLVKIRGETELRVREALAADLF